ncbi:MAG: MBL fold metallo-hydrolase [Planctomycetes bacterium]|nr:MBL fold metallo-hydrolase [Planctomycetota bacterium]
MIDLEFHGAAKTVTGSFHILHLPDGPIALDCGLFQGRRSIAREMNVSFPVPPEQLRAVLLSHAHLDHSGRIPQLFTQGFRGKIYATFATCDLCRVMLADSAHIQEEDARFWNEHRAAGPAERIEPLYTAQDVQMANEYFQGVPYNSPVTIAKGCTATFLEAGHILGSTCIMVEIAGNSTRLLYTGDLGRFMTPILRDPTNPMPEADYLITESTYANRTHADASTTKDQLVQVINETRALGGKVIIPAFSLGRTQLLVYCLSQAVAEGQLQPLPIYVDSPLSVNVTKVFTEHPECYDEQARDFWHARGNIFGRGLVTYITEVDQSKAINDKNEPCVIIASAGMCEAGRILHHLKNNVENDRNTVVIVGYMAQHTLGRRIVERNEKIKVFGREYDLLARVKTLNGFSAHADSGDFKRILGPLAKKLKGAFAVHGENSQLQAMKDLLTQAGCKNTRIPSQGEKISI